MDLCATTPHLPVALPLGLAVVGLAVVIARKLTMPILVTLAKAPGPKAERTPKPDLTLS